ncbi:hypothetical protein N7461_008920 [Penicillium sp. DV-2018c]|nr:hypothetical protein N7461_008920 [Penicillium sp. DV-2018c]
MSTYANFVGRERLEFMNHCDLVRQAIMNNPTMTPPILTRWIWGLLIHLGNFWDVVEDLVSRCDPADLLHLPGFLTNFLNRPGHIPMTEFTWGVVLRGGLMCEPLDPARKLPPSRS